MLIIVVLGAMFFAMAAVMIAMLPLQDIYHAQRGMIIRDDISAWVIGIDQWADENPNSGYPNLVTLQTQPGYEYLRLRNSSRYQFSTVVDLDNGAWMFSRAAVWFESPFGYVGNTAYLSAAGNTCGTQSFSQSGSWCGAHQSVWGKVESKEDISTRLLAEKQRQYKTMAKFYRRYALDGTFSPLANGQYRTLAQLVGYAGTASACAGVFVYNQIPFTCDDLFNYWGLPVVLNKISDKHIALVNRTQIRSSGGLLVRLAEEAYLE